MFKEDYIAWLPHRVTEINRMQEASLVVRVRAETTVTVRVSLGCLCGNRKTLGTKNGCLHVKSFDSESHGLHVWLLIY